jgi:serine/threonine-protein kinase
LDPVTDTTPLDRFPGKSLDGFLVEAPLGRGGMAAVFRARDLALNRPVALKVLRSQAVRDDATRQRFLQEARAAASLLHPNIVATYRAGETAGVMYMAMQYVNGRTLEKLLKHEGRLPARRALAIGREVALALEAAHAAGLAHRDIKPANIMIGPDGHVTVMDFGVAKPLAGEVMDAREFSGTPEYASPEQHGSGPVDARTDLWSLGVTLYQALTGRIPFVAENEAELRRKLAQEPPIPVRDLEPSVPPAVADLVHCLMSPRPEDRPATARDAVRAMDAAWRRSVARRPVFAAAALLLVAGAALASHKIRSWRPADLTAPAPSAVHGSTAVGPTDPEPAPPPIPSVPWTARPVLLVAEFAGPDGEAAWVRSALADILSAALSESGRAAVLPKSRMASEIADAADREAAAAAAARVHGAESVLLGEYAVAGERIHVHATLLRLTEKGAVKRHLDAVTTRREFSEIVAPMVEQVLRELEKPVKAGGGS